MSRGPRIRPGASFGSGPLSGQLPVALAALVALASVAYVGYRNLMVIKDRR